MAQHDYVLDNQAGAAFRSDLNNALSAIVSQNSGATAPATTYAYQLWADTTTGLLKIRNAANSGWITVGELASANLGLLASTAIGSTVQAYNANTAVTNTAQAFTAAQRGTPVALTSSSASIAVNAALGNNFTHTFTENTTLANPTNLVAGQSGVIVLTQHASSPKTLAFGSYWKFASGSAPSVTATNSAVDVLCYYVESTTRITAKLIGDVK